MKALIVYDSKYGNTEKIAHAIGSAFAGEGRVVRVSDGDVAPAEISALDVLLVGSPTQGGRPTKAIASFLAHIPSKGLNDIQVAAFDTRISLKDRGLGMRILLGIVGFAANRISARLRAAGGSLLAPPEGFIVEGTEGPLKQGEIERAAAWAEQLQRSKHVARAV
jgi:flavodoxin I